MLFRLVECYCQILNLPFALLMLNANINNSNEQQKFTIKKCVYVYGTHIKRKIKTTDKSN